MSKDLIATSVVLPPLVELVTNNGTHLKCHVIDVSDDYALIHTAGFSLMVVPCSVIVSVTPLEHVGV